MEHIRGVVDRITYQNTENGFSVIKCRVKNYTDLVTVVGAMPEVHVGSVLYMGGSWKMDGKYGRQFSMETFEETLPATVYGIEKYLGSGLVKGIGPKYAKKIVGTFGAETLNVIEEDPDKLNEISGIGKKRVERIKKSWTEQKEIKNIMLFLQSHDVSTAHATKIYKTYGNDSIKIVQENPYKLADDIWGIGFKTADTIAEKMGFGHEKYARLRSGIMYTLNKLSEEGHCYATNEMLLKTGSELLGVDDSLLTMTLDEMIRAKDVIVENLVSDDPQEGENGEQAELKRAIYLPPFYFSEVGVAKRLKSIYTNPGGFKVSTGNLAAKIASKTGMQYDDIQMQAIYSAVQNKLLVLTGGPGTGKTTTTLGIITAFHSAGARILLAAPTGRAAKRLSEATHMEAKTIHRLLEYKPPEGYQRSEENPLEGDVLIVDECSMIDVMLMYNLLKAVPDTMTVILVGDIDQLPSVGAGNVLRDIIDSDRFPVVRLTRIFRQAQTSRIIMNAHRINQGQMPDISNGKNSDFFFIDVDKMAADEGLAADDTAAIADMAGREIVKLVKSNLSSYYHIPSIQIQVLTPMQRGAVGAATLNQKLQEALNPEGTGLRRGGILYKTNDKVMQIRNNYDKEVFNGDIGIISSVDLEDRSLKVKFDEREVEYDISDLDELVLAYATTIHKAQGSEYPIVVMPVMMKHFVMLQRNLIYTGITRAKKILVIVGTKKALRYAVKNVTVNRRNTLLKKRLQEVLPLVDTVHTRVEKEAKREESEVKRIEQETTRVEQEVKRVKQEANRTEQETAKAVRIEPPKPTHEEWLKEDLWVRLSRSNFRSKFHLKEKDKEYVKKKGIDTIRSHAQDFVARRLAPAVIPNDGKQTPMHGHPVFIAQHATACCCRGCLFKWHGIPEGRALTKDEQDYVVGVLMTWIRREMDG
ncbi:MAG: ATP-dependent RecD-like DNA helicase [Bilifractor sp.]